MLPELAARLDGPEAGSHPESSRALLLDAIDALLTALAAGRPLVLMVDDLHAADPSTLGVLRYLLHSDRAESLLLLGAYRSTEVAAEHPLVSFYEELHRHQLVTRMELVGLDEAELDRLVADRAGARPAPDVVRALRRQTGGNPFFVEEILTSLAEQDLDLARGVQRVPEGARDVVRSRLRRLSDGAREALATAAVVGDTFDLRVIERVADQATLAGLGDAISVGFIEQSDDRLAFRHAVVRAELLHDLGRQDAANLHWKVGEALERIHSANLERHTAEVAHHLRLGAAAGDPSKASEYLERAGEQQFRSAALDEAVESLTAALDLSADDTDADRLRRMRILELLAEVQFWRADPDGMRAAALAAADLARRCGSPEDLARTVVVAARWNRGGELNSDLLARLDDAAARLPAGDSSLRSQVLAMRGYVLQGAARGFDSRSLAEEAEAMARRCDDTEALAMALLVRIYTEVGSATVRRTQHIVGELENASARLGRDDYRQQYGVFALRARAQVQLAAGDRTAFAATRAELGEVIDRMRATFWRSQVLQWDAALALAEGRFDDAAELAGAALATWDARPDASRVYLIQMAVAGLERGDHQQVLPEIERVVAGDASSVGYAWRSALAAGLAALGRADDARGRLEHLAADDFRGLADDHQRPHALRWLAEAIATVSAPDAARLLLPIAENYAGLLLVGPAVTTVEGAANRAIGQLLATLGRHDEAERYYEEAVELEAGLGFAALEARTRRWWAQCVLDRGAAGDADRARSLAQDAAARAERLGMGLLAASGRSLPGEAGSLAGAPRSDGDSNPHELTARE
jgi:tetratricopeptide (TPR) repeat protein